jgi:hypothetical protein
MECKNYGKRIVNEDNLVDGVMVFRFHFDLLTAKLPDYLREGLLAEFHQEEPEFEVRIERSAYFLLTWFNK